MIEIDTAWQLGDLITGIIIYASKFCTNLLFDKDHDAYKDKRAD
tara:strand:- start:249 stop:380 length:132 start_codon:yes stop_codon:yes gene_type:complete